MRTSVAWLLLFASIAFGAGLFGEFFLNDYALLSDPVLTSPTGWMEVWAPEQTRPLTYLTFWVNHRLGGANPFGYHAVNLALHLAAVWLAFAALKRLMPEQSAWVATALFATHPVQSEAVNYVFARGVLLMALFCLLSLNDWLRGKHWRAVLWFTVALLAKEEAVAWPLFLALLHLSVSRNTSEWRPIGVMLAMAGVFGIRFLFASALTSESGAGPHAGISAWNYFWTQGLVILRYIGTFLFPLIPYRIDSPVTPGFHWWAWLALLVSAFFAARRMSGARPGFWILAALALLLPSSSIFPAADLSTDRRMYLPVLAAGAAIALTLPRAAYALLLLIPLSMLRTWDYLDEERFWRRQASFGSVSAMVQLANFSEPTDAVQLLERAKGKSPDDPLVASELGRAYLAIGAPEKALAEFERGVVLTPGNPQALSNRGVALLLLKRREAAQLDFERALQIDPCAFEARLNSIRMGLEPPAAPHCRYTDEERNALRGE